MSTFSLRSVADRVLLQVHVEVLRAGLDGLVERRAGPGDGVALVAHLGGDGERDGGLEALARFRAHRRSPTGRTPARRWRSSGCRPRSWRRSRRRPPPVVGASVPVGASCRRSCRRPSCRRCRPCRRRCRRRRAAGRRRRGPERAGGSGWSVAWVFSLVHRSPCRSRRAVHAGAEDTCPGRSERPRSRRLTMRRISSYCLIRAEVDGHLRPVRRAGRGRRRGPRARRGQACCERWGIAKVTIDDIAADSGRVAGDAVPAVPRRQGRPVRGAAGARARGVLHRLRGQVEGADVARGPARAHRRLRHPRAARRRPPRADAGVRAGRRARPAHRRRPAADHPRRHRLPHPARRRRTCRDRSRGR